MPGPFIFQALEPIHAHPKRTGGDGGDGCLLDRDRLGFFLVLSQPFELRASRKDLGSKYEERRNEKDTGAEAGPTNDREPHGSFGSR